MDNRLEIPDYLQISNPKEVKEILILLKEVVKKRILKQYWNNDIIGVTRERIEELNVFGPYPDVIILNFEDLHSGSRYELSVDTYHGSGGEWSILKDE